ncbi:MAG: TMEM165/GDT1 family protein [Steroidobacteraceae bacterium]|jgi:putative Ca2+/H+ antiporter (TMEM165/GDT1 family)|nr:TMEM165/GDT1 family protein [Steroidobacteraceae bacterium]
MDFRTFLLVFGTVFMAELGDKTQLATLLYASEERFGRAHVFVAAALALVVSTALAVLAGSLVSKFIPVRTLQFVAGLGFVVIGVWTLYSAVRG